MLRKIFRKIKYNSKKKHVSGAESDAGSFGCVSSTAGAAGGSGEISPYLYINEKTLKSIFEGTDDIRFRNITLNSGNSKPKNAMLVFIDGMADIKVITEAIVEPFLYGTAIAGEGSTLYNKDIETFKQSMISSGEIREITTFEDALNGCFEGDTVLFVDGFKTAFIISTKGYAMRTIMPPEDEVNVRGAKESFVETLRVNTSMIRRRIKNSNLKFETVRLGKQTRTTVVVSYITGIADEKIVEEVRKRLKQINIDAILDSGYVEQLIDDAPFSIFETVGHTERPDVAAAKLLEGRIVIIIDGSPQVLTVPHLFLEVFQTPSDYYEKPVYSGVIRVLRITAFFMTILAPAMYVALTTFHQEFLPSKLMITMVKAREGIPFSAFFEALIMLFAFEILKEAGLRLPKSIGQTISIVGALIMGEAAVSAGIVSAPLVIVIAFTAVSGFVVSFINNQEFVLRIFFLIMAGVLGGYGIAIVLILLLVHLVGLKSFGYCYMSPFMPMVGSDQKDGVIRAPLWLMRTRPKGLSKKNPVREDTVIPPGD